MAKLWNFFSSVVLTIVLAILICMDAIWGSLLTVNNPNFYRSIDQSILLPKLYSMGMEGISYTLWIYILIALITLYAINTTVCSADRLYAIFKNRSPWQLILPHIVHVGFLIALVGHLLGSSYGFKSPENIIMVGETANVPTREALKVRVDDVEVKTRAGSRDIESLKTTVTLLENNMEILTGDIEMNGPLIYKGIAFYYMSHGRIPMGLVLRAGSELKSVAFDSGFQVEGKGSFKFGAIYPDFAIDGEGSAYSRSMDFTNPHQEIISQSGVKGYLNISGPGGSVTIDGVDIVLKDYMLKTYAVISINRDPGIWFIIVGSLVLTLGVILIFIFRGGRAELLTRDQGGAKT